METLTLTTPISLTTYTVDLLILDWRDKRIKVMVTGSSGAPVIVNYNGLTATTLMTQLNKVDLSVSSLHKRILQRLVADGFLPAGSVTGVPD